MNPRHSQSTSVCRSCFTAGRRAHETLGAWGCPARHGAAGAGTASACTEALHAREGRYLTLIHEFPHPTYKKPKTYPTLHHAALTQGPGAGTLQERGDAAGFGV